jgi:hypothetical protein
VSNAGVYVETRDWTADVRQIGSVRRSLDGLRDRAEDVRRAVHESVELLIDSAERLPTATDWQVDSLEATFGLAFTAEAGVVLTKASTEVSLEVTVTVSRKR